MTTIAESLQNAHQRVANCQNSSSFSHSVKLLAVSKTKPTEMIRVAYDAGQREFGENYVQEGVEKIQQLSELSDIQWHFIGPLQSNKTKPVAEHFDWVQSVDRAKIAKRLSEQRPNSAAPLQVCIQVNIDEEEQKAGVTASEVMPLAQLIADLPHLTLRGLMAIPINGSDEEITASFEKMHRLYQSLKSEFDTVDTLSMGMSGDVELAIKQGSTMVRMGTAIFGKRS